MESARRAKTVLMGDDTDLLILLYYYTEMSAEESFFHPEPRANSAKRRVWNMKVLKEKLGQDMCNTFSSSMQSLDVILLLAFTRLERGPL